MQVSWILPAPALLTTPEGHGSATHNEQMKKHGAGELVSVVEAEEGELMRRLALSRKGKLGS
eukprot:761428-Hanusia_phi.AAC.2